MGKGLKYASQMIVEEKALAVNVGSGELAVLATPVLVMLMENAAMKAVASFLEDGQTTVGGQISVSHLRPTPLGEKVEAVAELVEVNGRKLSFKVSASDSKGLIGEGEHLRFVVDSQRFMDKL